MKLNKQHTTNDTTEQHKQKQQQTNIQQQHNKTIIKHTHTNK